MLVRYINKLFERSFKKEWYKTYWSFDVHGTILKPNYQKTPVHPQFYPYAIQTLQLLTKREDIVMILSTSSYPEQIEHYIKVFKNKDIHFEYINENPEIDSSKGNFGYYKDKFYFDVMFEDKAGFSPHNDWQYIYNYLYACKTVGYLPNPEWTTKY